MLSLSDLDYLVPKAGFFCQICSLFYADETSVKNHCKTPLHQQNMEVMPRLLQTLRGSKKTQLVKCVLQGVLTISSLASGAHGNTSRGFHLKLRHKYNSVKKYIANIS